MSTFRARHKCKKIAQMITCAEGRELWVGELLERDEVYPVETHCIHLKTPEQDIVLGVYSGDAGYFAIIGQILHGTPINQSWIDTMERITRQKA